MKIDGPIFLKTACSIVTIMTVLAETVSVDKSSKKKTSFNIETVT